MKKLFIPMVVPVIGLVLFLACGEAGMEEQKLTSSDFEFIGQDHNEGMEYVFETLNATSNITSLSYEEGLSIIEVANREFIISKYNISDSEALREQISNIYASIGNNQEYLAKKSSDESFFSNSKIEDYLSENQLIFFNELDLILFEDQDISSLLNDIEELEERVLTLLTEEEKVLIYSATNVAKYSAVYWSKNYSNWENIFTENDSSLAKSMNFWRDLGSIAGWDVLGGVVGILGGLATGGVASVPLAAVGALTASTFAVYDMVVSQ
jgi:hypothetical protein